MRAWRCDTPMEAYDLALEQCLQQPDFVCSPRGMKVHEILGSHIEILRPTSIVVQTKDEERNQKLRDYAEQELAWYLSGDLHSTSAPSKFWEKIANPDGTINSNYGFMILYRRLEADHRFMSGPEVKRVHTPWTWARESLMKDRDSRQAIAYFNTPEYAWEGNKDYPCTVSLQFLIRDDRLFLITTMRSNDLVKGTPYDWSWFMYLQERMRKELSVKYEKLELGSYIHNAGSLHLYERDFDLARRMISA